MKSTVSALACSLLLIPLLLGVSFVSSAASAMGCLPDSVQVTGAVPAGTRLDAEQAASARIIVEVVVRRRMPSRAAVLAVATAMQESDLRNIPFGDRDSLGLFQQRPSQGWGGPGRVMNPVAATNAFLDHLADVPGWPALPLTVAAQAVQRSGFPDAYAKWEPLATSVVGGLLARPAPDASPTTNASDTPGLLVLADGLLASTAGAWPTTFQGGSVVIDTDANRTAHASLTALRRRLASAPDTVVISLGAAAPVAVQKPARHDKNSDGRRKAAASFHRVLKPSPRSHRPTPPGDPVDELLRAAGDRSIYWLTSPVDTELNSSLRHAASTHPRLTIVDLAVAVAAHRSWLDADTLSDAGRAGALDLLGRTLGTDGPSARLETAGDPCADGVGGYSAVALPDCGFTNARANPRSCTNAIRWALAATDGPAVWHRKCLHFVARAYGWSASGIRSAAAFWAQADERHLDSDPPAGALVFWSTGSPDGHVALSLGRGLVGSNDIDGAGTIAAVPLTAITTRWHATYLGWTPPSFHHGT